MRMLMKLPDIFSWVGALLAAAAALFWIVKKYFWASACVLFSFLGGLIAHIIGAKFDMFSEKGLKLSREMRGVSAALIFGALIIRGI